MADRKYDLALKALHNNTDIVVQQEEKVEEKISRANDKRECTINHGQIIVLVQFAE